MMKLISATQLAYHLNNRNDDNANVKSIVATIIEDIKLRGDEALLAYTEKFDGHSNLIINEAQIRNHNCDQEVYQALQFAADRIRQFHQEAPIPDYVIEEAHIKSGVRHTAIDTVAVYIPGGRFSYPSSVLMNIIPAQVAGVKRVIALNPTPKQQLNPAVLAALEILGVMECYSIGGAQAVASATYGTKTIPPADLIVGPGNSYVSEAKRQVYGMIGIDSVAGPSEITVVSDAKSDPKIIAWDLLSQAEHDPKAQSILITDDHYFLEQVNHNINDILATLSTAKIAKQSMADYALAIVVENIEQQAADIINQIAPEHLLLALDDHQAYKLFANIRHAGSIFIGRNTPEALADYVAGPNHVLPTNGSCRFASGLHVYNFMKRTTFLHANKQGFQQLAPHAITLAKAEKLEAHGQSLAMR
jgi:histidinol dehydrogenase